MSNQQQDPSGRNEVRWTQPFGWGLLLAFDDENDWELPDELGSAAVGASSSCLAVPVRHVYDSRTPQQRPRDVTIALEEVAVVVAFADAPDDAPVQFDGEISCRSGRLNVGDAE